MSLYTERRQASHYKHAHGKAEHRPWGLKLVLFFTILFLGFGGWLYFSDIRLFPIKSVKIEGDYKRIDQQEVKKVLLSFLTQNNFLTIKTNQIREQLLQIPWVDTVSVSREWPAKLIVRFTERHVVARWNGQHFMGVDGKVFPVGNDLAYRHLPLLSGPDGQQLLVWQQYTKMAQALLPTGLKITKLALSQRQAWHVELGNGVILILGRADALEKVQRAAQMYTKVIGSRGDEVEAVDLRYNNAIAVRWKKQNATGLDFRG